MHPLGVRAADQSIVGAERAGLEPDGVAVGFETCLAIRVQDLTELREAPSQRAARVVRHIPEQVAKPFPALGRPGYRQIGEQGPGLTRLRQRYQGAAAVDREIAEDLDFGCQA